MGGDKIKNFGIDISVWQKGISLSELDNNGVQFVIVRAGHTASDKSLNIDSQFEYNYLNLKNVNMPLGCYYYSRATTYEEGRKEAVYLYSNCLKNKTFEYPIYIDVEDTKYQQLAGKDNITLAIKGFCETLEDLGYYVGIYCNLNWANNYLNYNELKDKYDFWLAAWNNERPDTNKYRYGMWQFGGSINKLRSPVIASFICDQDYAYKDYPKIMKEKFLNGFVKKEEIEEPKDTEIEPIEEPKDTETGPIEEPKDIDNEPIEDEKKVENIWIKLLKEVIKNIIKFLKKKNI